jgi:hypothetical protein
MVKDRLKDGLIYNDMRLRFENGWHIKTDFTNAACNHI